MCKMRIIVSMLWSSVGLNSVVCVKLLEQHWLSLLIFIYLKVQNLTAVRAHELHAAYMASSLEMEM